MGDSHSRHFSLQHIVFESAAKCLKMNNNISQLLYPIHVTLWKKWRNTLDSRKMSAPNFSSSQKMLSRWNKKRVFFFHFQSPVCEGTFFCASMSQLDIFTPSGLSRCGRCSLTSFFSQPYPWDWGKLTLGSCSIKLYVQPWTVHIHVHTLDTASCKLSLFLFSSHLLILSRSDGRAQFTPLTEVQLDVMYPLVKPTCLLPAVNFIIFHASKYIIFHWNPINLFVCGKIDRFKIFRDYSSTISEQLRRCQFPRAIAKQCQSMRPSMNMRNCRHCFVVISWLSLSRGQAYRRIEDDRSVWFTQVVLSISFLRMSSRIIVGGDYFEFSARKICSRMSVCSKGIYIYYLLKVCTMRRFTKFV